MFDCELVAFLHKNIVVTSVVNNPDGVYWVFDWANKPGFRYAPSRLQKSFNQTIRELQHETSDQKYQASQIIPLF